VVEEGEEEKEEEERLTVGSIGSMQKGSQGLFKYRRPRSSSTTGEKGCVGGV
jgi:hypothetical protein